MTAVSYGSVGGEATTLLKAPPDRRKQNDGDYIGERTSHVPKRRNKVPGPWAPSGVSVSVFVSPDLQQQGWYLYPVVDFSRPGSREAPLFIDPRSFDPAYYRLWNCPDRVGWWVNPHMDVAKLTYHAPSPGLTSHDVRELDTQRQIIAMALRGLRRIDESYSGSIFDSGLTLVCGNASVEIRHAQALCVDDASVVGTGALMLARGCSHPFAMLMDARLVALDEAMAELNTESASPSIVGGNAQAHACGRTRLTVFSSGSVRADGTTCIDVVGDACDIVAGGHARVVVDEDKLHAHRIELSDHAVIMKRTVGST